MDGNPKGAAGKKIGLTCSYIPEEIILAAGLEPVQIRGLIGHGNYSSSYTCTNMCPYVENLLDSGLARRFDHLSGIIFANSCDCMRRLYDLWTHYVKTPFSYMLEIPKNQNARGVAYFVDRLFDLKRMLESAYGLTITDQDLNNAISQKNVRRQMTMGIIQGQKELPPRLSGRKLFSELILENASRKNPMDGGISDPACQATLDLPGGRDMPRLMVIGGRMDGNRLFDLVENAGGAVVIADYCNGLKDISREVDSSRLPMEAIAEGYLNGPACLRMPGFEGRLERIRHLIQEYQIHGLVYHRIINCDYGMFETPQLENFAQTIGMPLLVLETDYLWQDSSRIRTRIDAFLEMLTDNRENSY